MTKRNLPAGAKTAGGVPGAVSAYLSMPAGFNRETVARYAALNAGHDLPVAEIHGSINPSPCGSGRKPGELPQISLRSLEECGRCAELAGSIQSNAAYLDQYRQEILRNHPTRRSSEVPDPRTQPTNAGRSQ